VENLIWASTQIIVGLFLLVAGGEFLVRGASKLAVAMRISPLVIGLTVVAFGTSSPELAVSLQSAFAGNADIAMGNVVGSNIINVLLILGVSALIVPLIVHSQLVQRDVPVMIAASVLLLLLGLDGRIGRIDGAFLSTALLVYIFWCIRESRRESAAVQEEWGHLQPGGKSSVVTEIGLILAGLVLLGIGSHGLVSGAVTVATYAGVSQLVIGLTIVAAGTSLPEVVTSIMAAWRGERDIAVGNVVGSNLFNILCVVGFSSVVAPNGITVADDALRFDIPVMIAVAIVCLPIFFNQHLITRWVGGLFLIYYVAYTTYVVLTAMKSHYQGTLGSVMTTYVIPLTTLTLIISTVRALRSRRTRESSDGASST